MSLQLALMVGVGAGLGSGIRFLLSRHLDRGWPIGTFLANVAGSALVGACAALLLACDLSEGRLEALDGLLVAGLGGGLTTYSGFAVQTYALGWRRGALYASITVLVSLGACVASYALVA